MPTPDPLLADLDHDQTRESGARFLDLIARYLDQTSRGDGPVGTTRTPEELEARFREAMPQTGHPLDEVLGRIEREIVPDVTRLTHPMYMGHQVSAPLPASIWVEALISAFNNSTAVQEMAPPVTIIEHQLVRWMGELVGWPEGCGGTLTSGGTEATFTALLAARAAVMPDAWEDGVGANPPVVVYGEQSHYAVARAIGQLGLGLRNGIAVPTRDFRIDTAVLVETLDRLEREGRRVMAVVATAGSTPTGSFDDLEAIGRLCETRDIWFHVDGAHGATALFSERHRHRVWGIHRARSLAWDPHKTMLLPLSAGMVLLRHEAELEQAFLQRAPYLFHRGENAKVWDLGPKSFQCSRRGDALKVWLVLQRYGARMIGELYDRLCATSERLHGLIGERATFQAMHRPEGNILCFRYLADGHRNDEELDRINFELRQRYN
ncbi:MAG TPA: pyridoxal-dependent decarboxylase, partial [Gemmatimonadales bacterium]|nr:pyridoxal-dependent decarboxylase [Gemmatimonadales bacterium]